MSRVQMLRAMVEQRLTAAVEEICGLFERTIAEYEEEVSHSKQENDRLRKLLDAVLNPYVRLHRADVQQLLASKEVPPSLDQENPEPLHIKEEQENPEFPHIKEEQEELWTSQQGEQLQGLEEADITEFTFTPVPVKSEDDEEEPQSSQLHQSQSVETREASTSTDQENPEPLHIKEEQENPEPLHIKEEQEELWTSQEGEQLQGLEEADITKFPFTPIPVKSEDDEEEPQSSQPHQSQGEENREAEPRAGTSTDLMNPEADGDCRGSEPASNVDPARDVQPTSAEQLLSPHCPEPETEDSDDDSMETNEPQSDLDTLINNEVPGGQMGPHTGGKPFSCPHCGTIFLQKGDLKRHMRVHTGEKPFSCSVCNNSFSLKHHLVTHMRVHTGEKPFTCSVCNKRFSQKNDLVKHMRVHTGEKPFTCSVCNNSFSRKHHLVEHMRVHTGEKPFTCSVCNKRFSKKHNLVKHMRIHNSPTPHSRA